MQRYLIMVISAAVLSAVAGTLSPEKWRKYLNAVTGIMIMSVIVSPVYDLKTTDLFSDYSYNSELDMNAQKKAVCDELKIRVSEDAKQRIKQELGNECNVEVQLELNNKYEIEGVKEITVWTKSKKREIKQLLQKVYSPGKISFRN